MVCASSCFHGIKITSVLFSFSSSSCLVPSQVFSRCPAPQRHQVVCRILALHLGRVCPQGPSWAPALDQIPHRALFTAWWAPALDPEHPMHLMACRARDKVITLRTACILCIRYSLLQTMSWCHYCHWSRYLYHSNGFSFFNISLCSLINWPN